MRRLIGYLDPLMLGLILGMVFVAMTNPSASLLGKAAEERGRVSEASMRFLSGAGGLNLALRVALPPAWNLGGGISLSTQHGEAGVVYNMWESQRAKLRFSESSRTFESAAWRMSF